MNKLCTIALFILFSSFLSLAQTAILERNISLEISQESISTALKKISRQGDFTFSYNPSIIEANKIISFSANNKTVREVLFMIFQSKVSFKEKGKYLILQKNQDDENSKYFFVSGYILDYQTGKKLIQASVYEPLTFASAVSNKYGYYQIKLPIKTSTLTIKAIKQNYQRQDLVVEVNKNQNINIILTPEPSNTIEVADIRKQDSLEIKKENPMLADSIVIQMVEVRGKERQSLAEKLKASFSTFFTSANQKIHQINVKDILSKKWQVGLVPYLSTNQLMGNTEVNFSLNFISGYNSGVKKAELGGGVNIVRNSVNGVQVGGLLNLVGKQMKGVQLSGLGNIVGGDVDFLQVGGLFNLNKGAMNGVQLGGLFNLNTMAHTGFQAAGLFNFNNRPSEGVQIGGLFNYQSDDYKGVQIGGLFNYMPHELKGVQISGLFNFAKKVRSGVQIGLFNYADSAVSLVPIGLFSYIRRGGYHPVEISINEMEFVNIAMKTGVKKIYTILTVGMQPHQLSKRLWHFGYGIGSYWSLSRRLAINLDLTVHQINQDSFSRFLNLLNRASLSMEIKGKYWGLALGPAWNLLLTDWQNGNYQPIFDDFPSLSIRSNEVVESGLRIRSWIGGQVAVRMGK